MLLRPQSVQKKIENLDADEKFMADSQRAVCSFDLGELMIDSINIYGDICRLDDNFHTDAFAHPENYDAELASVIKRLFQNWYEVVERSFALLEAMKGEFVSDEFDTKSHDELRRLFSECHAILNPCEVECDSLANEAIEENHQGKTVSM